MKRLIAAFVALVATSTLAVQAATNDTDQAFVLQTYRTNLLAIREARIVKRNAVGTNLRDFAQMMIDDHSLSNVELRSAARVAGVVFPDLALEEQAISVMTSTNPDGTVSTVTTTTITTENPYGSAAPEAIALQSQLAADGWIALSDTRGPGWGRQYWHNAEIELRHLGDLMNNEMANGSDPTLRRFADQQDTIITRETAIVRQHLDETFPGS